MGKEGSGREREGGRGREMRWSDGECWSGLILLADSQKASN